MSRCIQNATWVSSIHVLVTGKLITRCLINALVLVYYIKNYTILMTYKLYPKLYMGLIFQNSYNAEESSLFHEKSKQGGPFFSKVDPLLW
jgi:hypothetical protein